MKLNPSVFNGVGELERELSIVLLVDNNRNEEIDRWTFKETRLMGYVHRFATWSVERGNCRVKKREMKR
jgi:hypothetical protein